MSQIKKKKYWSQIESHDYWMGMAFMYAIKSRTGNASLIIDASGKMTSYGLESPPYISSSQNSVVIPSEINAVLNNKSELIDGTIYSTSPPTYEAVLTIIANSGFKKIYYYPTCDIDSRSVEAIKSVFIDIEEYKCNLNWIRDYFMCLEHK